METESFPAAPETPIINQAPVKNSKLLILLILLIIFLATIIGVTVGYLLGSSKNQPIVSAPVVSPAIVISSPIPTTTPDLTANWKTYTNEKYKFSLKYPNDWTFIDVYDSKVAQPPIMELHSPDRDYIRGTAADIYFTTSPAGQPDSSRLKQIGITGNGIPQVFGNLDGILYKTDGVGEAGSGYRADFIFKHNPITYWIYVATDLRSKLIYNPIFDQILSTFEFLE